MAKKRTTKSKSTTQKKTTKKVEPKKELSILDKLNSLRIDGIPEQEPVEERKYKPLGEYVKVTESSKQEKFVQMGKRVESGEIELAYFTTENSKGVYYYRIINKK